MNILEISFSNIFETTIVDKVISDKEKDTSTIEICKQNEGNFNKRIEV